MLTKLLKYDLKYMTKSMIVFYILSLFFAITTRFFKVISPSTISNILYQISLGCLISMIVNIIINTMLRCWTRFKSTLYGDESYLTHTLPVSKKSIYESKFLLTIIFLLIGFIVIVFSLFIALYSKENMNLLKEIIYQIGNNISISNGLIILLTFLILFIELFNGIQSGYLGIIFGHRKNNGKIGYSILYGFIIYNVIQLFILLIVYIMGLFNNNIMSLFTSTIVMDNSIFITIIILSIVVYSLISIVLNMLCVKMLNKGVNVE